MSTVLIMAGGTGGHVFPALALARVLRAASHDVVWLGTRRGLEARVIPAENIDIEYLAMSGLRGKGALTLLAAPFKLLQSVWQALGVMRRRDPALVVGFGGFVTGPGGVAAWLTRRPLVIHEQNAIAGYSNRSLSHLARRVLTAFPDAFPRGVDAQVVGNPVRAEILAQPEPGERFARREGALRVLVVGGSLGATRLNTVVPFAVKLSGLDLRVRHQAGEKGIDAARQAYADAGVTAEVTPFIDDMARAYSEADLVICRAGALTISELAAVGVAAVLVPFPAAVDDHQTHNARYLVREDAAVLIADRELTPERLSAELKVLCEGRGKLLSMALRARAAAKPRATDDLAQVCLQQLGVAA
ncbi:MAG TPA: undecaprenyldiphospho-muramoylpentapeptide beta-N-acetylglucosaminyltransferase [Steroidobacteraceae bacterium]|nr:undecaprenyldiphospho-muramoylpentapeptide beta-N-acetylglucosaminyltransferase [Steroidobacteraceae bacterium]